MKIMVTSLKRSQACTVTVRAPQPCSRPPLTHAFAGDPGHPPGKSPVGSLFLSPRSWCTKFCLALQESISQSYVSSGSSIVGLMATTSKRVYAIPTPRAPVSVADHCQPVCTSTGGTQFCLSFCGVPGSWCAQDLFEPSGSLWLNGFDSKHQFAPPTILLSSQSNSHIHT